jgi:hypothetical protein
MARTYLTNLVSIVRKLCTYIDRYGPFIESQLADGALTAFQALRTACTAFMVSGIVDQAKND